MLFYIGFGFSLILGIHIFFKSPARATAIRLFALATLFGVVAIMMAFTVDATKEIIQMAVAAGVAIAVGFAIEYHIYQQWTSSSQRRKNQSYGYVKVK